MKKLMAISFLIFAIACAKGGGGSSSSVIGTDVSGTYMFDDVECYNASLTTLTNASTYTGAYSDTVTISGNSFSEVSTAGSCTINDSGSIVVNSNGLSLSGIKITSATSGSCTQTLTLNNANISPNSVSTTYSTNQSLSNITNATYLWNPTTKALGILSTYADGGGGYCFLVYLKQ